MAKQKLEDSLKQKGWSEEEIKKALTIMKSSEDETAPKYSEAGATIARNFNVFVYWTALIVSVMGNIMLSVLLVPFLLYLTSWMLYLMVGVVALTFGILFNSLINSIESLDYKHHIIAGVFIPFIALFNIFIMVRLSNQANLTLKLSQVNQSPWLIGAIYVFCFMVPYLVTKVRENLPAKK